MTDSIAPGWCSRGTEHTVCEQPAVYVLRFTGDPNLYGVCAEHAPEVYGADVDVEWIRTYTP